MAQTDTVHSWLWEGARGALGLLVAAVVILMRRDEAGVRYAGGALLFLGGWAVMKGFIDLRTQFGIPLIRQEVWGDFRRAVARLTGWVLRRLSRRGASDAQVNVSGVGAAGGRGDASAETIKHGPIEGRVADLERQMQDEIAKRATDKAELIARIAGVSNEVKSERDQRESAQRDAYQQMETFMTGGLRFQVIGVIWLLFGTALTTTAPDLGGWLGRY